MSLIIKQLPETPFQQYLDQIGACIDSRVWANTKTSKEAWEQCSKIEWLLRWIEIEQSTNNKKLIRVILTLAKETNERIVKTEIRHIFYELDKVYTDIEEDKICCMMNMGYIFSHFALVIGINPCDLIRKYFSQPWKGDL